MKEVKRLAILKPSSIGDILHVFPGLEEFMQQHPNVEIHWIVDERFCGVVQLFHRSIKIHALNRNRIKLLNKLTFGFYSKILLRHLKHKIDVVLDLSFRVSDVSLIRKIGKPVIGVNKQTFMQFKGNHFISDQTVIDYYDFHLPLDGLWPNLNFITFPYVDFYRQSFAKLGEYEALNDQISGDLIKHFGESEEIKEGKSVLFFHSTSGDAKNWKLVYWKQLANLLADKGYNVYLVWFGQEEYRRAKEISKINHRVYVLPEMKIEEIASVIQRVDFVVGCDTGLTHLASLMNAKVARIWGSTSTNAKIPSESSIDFVSTFECSPCSRMKGCPKVSKGQEPPCYDEMLTENLYEMLERNGFLGKV